MSSKTKDTLYSAGWCPICPGAGQLVIMTRVNIDGFVFYCPSCEAAWDSVPNDVDHFHPLKELAPNGIILPSFCVITENFTGPVEEAYEEWHELMDIKNGFPDFYESE